MEERNNCGGCVSPPSEIEAEEESPNPSPTSTMENKRVMEPCLVCGIQTSKIHFQVNSCRACAAFFRRSIKFKNPYRCQRSVGSCDVTIKTIGKPLCRYCRLKKCIQIGMKTNKNEKFPINYSDESMDGGGGEDIKPNKIESTTVTTTTRPSVIIHNTPCFGKRELNIMKVFQTINVIFDQKTLLFRQNSFSATATNDENNITERFSKNLGEFLETTKPTTKVLIPLIDFNDKERVIFFENFLIKVAQLLSQFEYFANLHSTEKLLLYKRFWQIFSPLERCYHSTEHFGSDPSDTRIVIDHKHFIEISNTQWKVPTNEKQKDANIFLLPFINNFLFLVKPMKKANISLYEFSYICQIILWSCYEITELSEATQKFADEMINKVSNELHEYYIHKMRMPNYAARQAQLFKLIQIAEFIFRGKKQLMTANEIFNFIESDFHFSILN